MFAIAAILMCLGALGALIGSVGIANAHTKTNSKGRMALPMRSRTNDTGSFNIGAVLTLAGGVIVLVVSLVVVFNILGSNTGQIASAVKNTSNNVSNSDWGSTSANAIAPSLGLIISLVGLFAIVLAAAGVLYLQKNKGGGL